MESPVSTSFAIPNKMTILIAQPTTIPRPAVKNANTESTERIPRDTIYVGKSDGN